MIQIKDLHAGVKGEEKNILLGVDLNITLGKNYCLLGKNGSGKSTLSSVIAGSPKYSVNSGEILISGQARGTAPTQEEDTNNVDLLAMSPEERSAAGIFLAFQNVPEIPGIKLSEYLRTIYNNSLKNKGSEVKELSPFIFKRFVKKYLDELQVDPKFLDRDLNVGFSGGEKRKIEILQMKLIEPKYIILDEIDSGLDLDAFKTVASMLQSISSNKNTFIIITHYFTILDYIEVDEVHIMKDGKIVRSGERSLVDEIKEKGFE